MIFKKLFNKKRWDKFRKDLTQGIIGNMLFIPSGSFLMGSNNGEMDERPVHNVLIDSFYMGEYEITQKEWYEVMETKPWENLKYAKSGDKYPVVNVSWYDVKDFIEKLNNLTRKNFRLPTEAEWEYACRAGSSSKFFHGSLKYGLSNFAWYYDNAFKKDEMYGHEKGKKAPNKWGLYDMLGNVYEWCSDWYGNDYYNKSPVNNPKGPRYGSHKVIRGGDWSRTDYFLRVSSRRYYSPHSKDSFIGFRIVMDIGSKDEEVNCV